MRLFVRESGDPRGRAVVLLHAFPLSSAMWEPQVEALRSFRVIAPDLRGFGGTPLAAPWFIEHAVDDALETLSSLGVERAVLVGLSMGGYVALRAVEKAPARVEALVLCDTRAEADSNEGKIKRAAAVDLIRSRGVAAFAAPFFKDALSPASLARDQDLARRLELQAGRASVETVTAALAALAARPDMTESLARIAVPTLILVGQDDKITPPPLAEAMRARIPGARLRAIPAAGHFSNMENPGAFNESLLSFLGGAVRP